MLTTDCYRVHGIIKLAPGNEPNLSATLGVCSGSQEETIMPFQSASGLLAFQHSLPGWTIKVVNVHQSSYMIYVYILT
jgi:hypothetical protein